MDFYPRLTFVNSRDLDFSLYACVTRPVSTEPSVQSLTRFHICSFHMHGYRTRGYLLSLYIPGVFYVGSFQFLKLRMIF